MARILPRSRRRGGERRSRHRFGGGRADRRVARGRRGKRGDAIATGEVEYDGTIGLGSATGTLTVVNIGVGREVGLSTSDLPILPKGEYYEVWFVGPGDSPQRPNRISAGTFHPNEDGESEITLTAAVDPSLYPQVVVTAESGNGDPSSSGRVVLRAEIG